MMATSSRERAGALAARAFAGAPPAARALVLELDRTHGLCVLATGDRPAAVWRLELGALRALAGGAAGALRAEADRLVLGMRLAALRGSIGDVVVVGARAGTRSRLVAAALQEAIAAHVRTDDAAPTVLAA